MEGNHSLDATYFQDMDANPVLGDNYYRLKQIFDDGSFDYSAIRAIKFGIDLHAIETFSNPAQNELYINLKEYAGQKGSILISNQFGTIIEEIKLESIPNDLVRLDLRPYNNGLYLLRTKIAKGTFFTKKIVVSKMY